MPQNASIYLFRRSRSRRCLQLFVVQLSHNGKWTTPGGIIDPGDRSPFAAARREFFEEVGVNCPFLKSYVYYFYNGHTHLYIARVDDWNPPSIIQTNETMDGKFHDVSSCLLTKRVKMPHYTINSLREIMARPNIVNYLTSRGLVRVRSAIVPYRKPVTMHHHAQYVRGGGV